MTAREEIFNALFALVSTGEGLAGAVGWDSGAFRFTSRRVRDFSDPALVQPALCQAEHAETLTQQRGLPYRSVLKAKWIAYHQAGANTSAVPATTNNLILDALTTALTPSEGDSFFPRNTLGGLVHNCFIDGEVFKDPGDLDNQALVILPITILVP